MWVWLQEILDRRDEEKERLRQHELELRHCRSCDVLERELAKARDRETELLKALVTLPTKEETVVPFQNQIELPKRKSWAAKRTELELKHRKEIKPSITVDSLEDEIQNAKQKA